ncbi:MAG: amidohydrolase, partial [Saprospiraceae bacterium]|nr:amidohydrolase [Saprospiraceae bacterium]
MYILTLSPYRACLWLLALACCVVSACSTQQTAELIIFNANIYTVDPLQPDAQAIAIADGRVLALGDDSEILALQDAGTEVIDAGGNFVMTGFIEGHGHFTGLGSSLQNLNFLTTKTWQDIVAAVAEKAAEADPGEWIIGRGWHQEKWVDTLARSVLGYPYHNALSAVSPDNPVMLSHASGHGLMANAKAMEIAGVTTETPNPSGGNIVRDENGEAIGVFEENAMSIIREAYRQYTATLSEEELTQQWYEGIALAEEECLRKGVTSFQDAGSSIHTMERLEELAENGELDVRLYAMIRHEYEYLKDRLDGYPVVDAGDGFFTCRAVKLTIDGALGSYGAWLLEDYDDNPDFYGQNVNSIEEMQNLAELCIENEMQFCTHAIGDRANREALDVYQATFTDHPDKSDLRWRIEHAQHLAVEDIPRFGELGVIASMQGIHCTSDAPFVVKRLGEQRAREGAYAWRSLLASGAVVTNGTDAPVEDVDPIASYYATVTRKRADTGMEFFPEQRMTREEAIYSYTMANAFAAFEEDQKGSLETGKYGDLVILSNDLINCSDEEILETQVLLTV